MGERKEQIITSTLEWIAVNGATDMSSKKLAEHIGCSEALIFKYFPSKDALFQACLERINALNERLVKEVVPKSIEGKTALPDILKAVSDAYLRFHVENWAGTMAFEHFSKSIFTEEMRAEFTKSQTEYIGQIVQFFGLGPAIQKFESVLPFSLWWNHMLDVTMFLVRKVHEGLIEMNDHLCDVYFDMLYNGLRTTKKEAQ